MRGATSEEEVSNDVGDGGESTRRRIQWAEDVVDNEGLGRKSSKGMRECFFIFMGEVEMGRGKS